MNARMVGLAALLSVAAQAGTIQMRPYFDPKGNEVILVWDESSGRSKSWYYDDAKKAFVPSDARYQLPAKLSVSGTLRMAPYLGADHSEVVLVWDAKSGKSVSYYFDNQDEKFKPADASMQLPKQAGADVMMAPYLAKDGSEVILVWDTTTGASVNWYFNNADHKFEKSESGYQLPASLGLKPPVMMVPYLAKDGSEVIQTWSRANGQSFNWYYDNADKKMKKSEAGYQLPAATGVKANVEMFPYLAKDGSEVMLVWDSKTGQSVNWYYDGEKKVFQRSTDEYQLPAKPLGGKAAMLLPYLDAKQTEVILAWDPSSGASKGYYHDDEKKKVVPAGDGFQLPANPLAP